MAKPPVSTPIDGLLDLACRDGVDIRPTLLRVLTDLYVQKPVHTTEEETQYVELSTGLIDMVDEATRATVTATLRAYPAAPKAVLHRLGAAPAPISATPAAAKGAANRDDLTELFFSAPSDERRLILRNLAPDATAQHPAPADVLARLEAAALKRNPTQFARLLAAALGVAPALAERIVADASGEPLVVSAKALGMSAAALQRVLLFLDPAIGQSVQRVYDLAQLFDDITPQAASQMTAIWRGQLARKGRAYEPGHYDDERRSARSFASPGRHARPSRATPPVRKNDRTG
jgi:uncharacterized protein (DUF2336 family)